MKTFCKKRHYTDDFAYGDKEQRTVYLISTRKQWGITQAEMAEYLNISKRTYESWENKRQAPAAVTALIEEIEQLRMEIYRLELFLQGKH